MDIMYIYYMSLYYVHLLHESQNKLQLNFLKKIMKVTNKMQLYRLIYFSLSPLHVSGNVFAHHQEHLTVFTVSCWLLS